MTGIMITAGTQTNIQTDLVGTTNYQIVKIDRGVAGASSLFTGTLDAVTSVANIVKGTVTALGNGTIGAGTVQTYGLRHADAFATVVSTGTNVMGTIKAGVAGSIIYVTDLVISAGSATNVEIGNGGTNLPLLGTLHLAANGGAVLNFNTPLATGAGSTLVYKQSTAISPLSLTVLGYVD